MTTRASSSTAADLRLVIVSNDAVGYGTFNGTLAPTIQVTNVTTSTSVTAVATRVKAASAPRPTAEEDVVKSDTNSTDWRRCS